MLLPPLLLLYAMHGPSGDGDGTECNLLSWLQTGWMHAVPAVAVTIAQIINPSPSYIALGREIDQSAGGKGEMQGPAH